jgi:alkylation response protein AidB-like acyl-CoA dehydrogenase
MHFAFDEAQQELREQARAFLAEHAGSEAVRRAMASESGFDPGLWKQLSAELGWTALLVPEEYGGLGLGHVELAALLEVTGEALLCAPFFSTVCLGVQALLVAGSEAQRAEFLPAIAAGARHARAGRRTAAGREGSGRARGRRDWCSPEQALRPRRPLRGPLVVAGPREGQRGQGVSLFLVPARAAGVTRTALPTLDQTRRLAEVTLRDVRVPASALLGEEEQGAAALARIHDLAAIALAAEQVGGAQRCLDLAVAYAKERIQFGRPIGSFQAIQHKCADRMVDVEAARSGAYYAACVAAEGGAELAAAASLAKSTASEAYVATAAECLQIHGGVGFTWEYDVHLHLKRARGGESLLGDPAWHRERVARHLGL